MMLTPLLAVPQEGFASKNSYVPGTVAGSSSEAVRCRCMTKDEMRTPQAKSPSGLSMRYADRVRSIALGFASSASASTTLLPAHHEDVIQELIQLDGRGSNAQLACTS